MIQCSPLSLLGVELMIAIVFGKLRYFIRGLRSHLVDSELRIFLNYLQKGNVIHFYIELHLYLKKL